jgi:SAM-dependent methyltransferase
MSGHEGVGKALPPSREEAEAAADLVPGSALSARLYDPVLWWGERTGLARNRHLLLGEAEGQVVEIGAGTGLNLRHYDPARVEGLALVEPERHKAAILGRKVTESGLDAEVVRAPASALPFEDDSFDTAVVTLCFCTVPDPLESMTELARVLKQDGRLLFMEHIRSERSWLGPLQDFLRGPWSRLADGCQCNRRTLDLLREGGWEVEVLHTADSALMPPVARPIVSGRARIASRLLPRSTS